MGCCFSFQSSKCSSFKNIRVVHLNGCLEEFEHPLAVSEVTGKPAKHFVLTYAQLVSAAASSHHLKPDTILEPGHVYFLLPHSTFQSDVSPLDLVPIARRLAAIANNCHQSTPRRRKTSSSPVKSGAPPSCSPNRFSQSGTNLGTYAAVQRKLCRRSWKPVLSSIREFSFNRRSESDLLEKSFDKRDSLDAR